MKAQLEAAGYAHQVFRIENMIANGCRVLVIASIDGEAQGIVLDQAKAAVIFDIMSKRNESK